MEHNYKSQSASIESLSSEEKEIYDLIKLLSNNFETYDAQAVDLDNLFFQKVSTSEIANEQIDIDIIDTDEVEDPIISDNMLWGDNFFKNNEGKILGEQEISKDRYGKQITITKGGMSNINAIDVHYVQKPSTAVISVDSNKKETVDNLEHNDIVVQNSEKSIVSKILKKAKKKEGISDENSIIDFDKNVRSFEEIYKEQNPNISQEELRVFVWHKHNIGQPLSKKWENLAGFSSIPNIDSEEVRAWVNSNLLCYYKGQLIPAYMYFAENVYNKIESLTGQSPDRKYIIDNYGEDVLINQLAKLKEVYSVAYGKRLLVGQNEDSLVLIPTSKFCKQFTIKTLIDEKPFKAKRITASSSPNFGKIDFLSQHKYRDYQKNETEELSLTDAFQYWLINYKNEIQYKKSNYSDIIRFYIDLARTPNTPKGVDPNQWKAQYERIRAKAKDEGDRLFALFLDKYLTFNDKIRIEKEWNAKYNGYVPIDYLKVPVAFNVTKKFKGEEFDIKWEKREAVSFVFSEGSGCLAFDVGVGKTISAILTIEQFIEAGYCKRPFIVVPNPTYRQWLAEIRDILPHRTINDLYNFRKDYVDNFKDENDNIMKVDENSISVMTYEGFDRLSFNETTENQIFSTLYDILNQGGQEDAQSEKKKAGFRESLQDIIGRGLKGGMTNIEDLGFDFVAYDEAHAMKKVFTVVKGEQSDTKNTREKTQYKINSGSPSTVALKGFMISQYIMQNNNNRNVLLLTATPFTNSPLEIFSMLSLIAYHKLSETDLNNITLFFDNYINCTTELVINAKLKPQYKQVIKGFNNLPALQQMIRRFFNYKTGEDVNVLRPNKVVLPLSKKVVDGNVFQLEENERVDTYIDMNETQALLMDNIKAYAEGTITESQLGLQNIIDDDYNEDIDTETGEKIKQEDQFDIDEESLSDDEKAGVRTLKAMNFGRNLALSPYLYEYSGMKNPTYKDYIDNSPKLKYVIECVRSVRDYHIKNNEPISGQIIYMDRGIKYFSLIKDYLVHEVGYKEHEVGIIYSQMRDAKHMKDKIKDGFNGLKYNDKTKLYENLSDDERVKIIIGSSTIKEGMNLQRKTTVLYNCFIDWNPTDFLQLCGRAWRQGNEFSNVRIVVPLVIDSIDIFMFQKLEEKTDRINSIWSSDGRSVLKLEDINPSEIKNALIKNPKILAEIQIEEESSRLKDDLIAFDSEIDRVERLKKAFNMSKVREPDMQEIVKGIRPKKADKTGLSLIKEFNDILTKKIDGDGKKMISSWEKRNMTLSEKREKNISDKDEISKPYWYDDYANSVRTLEREKRDYLTPNNYDEKDLDFIVDKINAKKEEVKVLIKDITSDESILQRTEIIIAEREQNKISVKTIAELVNQFKGLNYLLSIKKQQKDIIKVERELFTPLKNDEGKLRIDDEAIFILEDYLENGTQTKEMYVDINGVYSEDRVNLHNKIIKDLRNNKECITNDKPIAILTGGSPASGKSTFLNSYSQYFKSEYIYKIDADDIRSKLPEYEGWNASLTHEETKDIVNYLLTDKNIGIPCNYDVVYDGTMNKSKNYLPLIGQFKRLGYQVFIIYFTNIPYEEIVNRTRLRYQRTGRYVPIGVVDDFFSKGEAALHELKNKVDGYMVIDGNTKNYNVIERGGLELPKERPYSKLRDADFKEVDVEINYKEKLPSVSKKEIIEKKIKGLSVVLKYADKNARNIAEKKLKGLKVALKYIKDENENLANGGNINAEVAEMLKSEFYIKLDVMFNKPVVFNAEIDVIKSTTYKNYGSVRIRTNYQPLKDYLIENDFLGNMKTKLSKEKAREIIESFKFEKSDGIYTPEDFHEDRHLLNRYKHTKEFVKALNLHFN